MLAYGDCSYTYTEWGALATRDCTGAVTVYDYDVLGNLLRVTLPSLDVVDYDVDALGRRIRRRHLRGGAVLSERRYLYGDGLNPIAELDGSGRLVSVFVYGTRTNVPDLMIDAATGSVYRYIVDGRGSVRQVVDAITGEVVQRLDYDAFGFVLGGMGAGFQPFGFAGGIYDADTGLVRFGARDYDPATGRWTAKEPRLLGSGSYNMYVYASSDPVNYVDLDGNEPVTVAIVTTVVGLAIINGLINGTVTAMQARSTGVDAGEAFVAGFTGGFVGGIAGGFLSLVNPVLGGGVGGALGNGLTTALLASGCDQYDGWGILRSVVIGGAFGAGGGLVSNGLNFRTVAGGRGGGPVHAFAGEILASGTGNATSSFIDLHDALRR